MDYKLTLWGEKFENSTDASGNITNEWKKEYCICTIASNSLASNAAAYNLQLQEKVNGERNLSFKMSYQYYDIDEQAYVSNPYLGLLVNERIVKLEYNNKIYSFVITEVTKSSDKKEISVSCVNTVTRELGKNGYSIVLDTELENNMGNITTLAEYIMEDTDWHVVGTTPITTKNNNTIKSEIIHAYLNEPLYWYELTAPLEVVDMLGEKPSKTIPTGSTIYISAYSYDNRVKRPQLYWRDDGAYITNEDSVITNSVNWQPAEGVTWIWPETQLYISASYRGKSLVNKATTKYCPKIDEYCTKYKKLQSGSSTNYDYYYGFNRTEYLSNANIVKLIYNQISLGEMTGWTGNIQEVLLTTTAGSAKYGLQLFGATSTKEADYSLTNSVAAFADSGLTTTEEYVIAFHITEGTASSISNIYFQGRNPNSSTTGYVTYATAANLSTGESCPDLGTGWLVKKFTFTTAIPYNELVEYALQLHVVGSSTVTFDDIKMFRKVLDDNNHIIVPDLTVINESVVRSKTVLVKINDYNKDDVSDLYDLKLTILDSDDLETNGYLMVYNDDYELVTSITASQSNRFNLIQDVCEKFECWSDYTVETNNQGRINYYYKLTSDDLYKSGKQYYTQLSGATSEELFDDAHYIYVDKDDLFTPQTSTSTYYYNGKDYYYYEDNGEYLQANLGYQWNQKQSASSSSATVFYIVSSYTDAGDPVYTVATSYDATTQYYILDATSKYVMVNVGNEFASAPTDYYHFDGFNNEVYEKYYEKFLVFHDYTGKNNYAGFKYGINLNNISRKLDSTDIATKVIVASNSNSYADGGMCSIVDAAQNGTHSNVLYDFNYYVNKNLLDKNTLARDLYGDASGGLAYLSTYTRWNEDNLALTDEYSQVTIAYSKAYSNQTSCEQQITAAQEGYDDAIDSLKNRCGLSDSDARSKTYASASDADTELKSLLKKRDTYTTTITEQTSYLAPFRNEAKRLKLRLNKINQLLSNDTTRKKALDKEFYSRYGRFIQEGTWSSEDYIDADLYYYDACKVLHNSAYPQISYTINVADVSGSAEYPEYEFAIGDITYIRDTEFFADQGTELQNKFQVIVSEINRTLDDPTKNTITVVNYLTKFEDLFQRVAAATQALQYNEGKYDNAANAVSGEVIDSELLSRSLEENDAIISNSGSQEVVWDSNGITVNDSNLANKLRIVGNGIVLSNDAGKTWHTGISSTGINADAITTGTLDVNRINLCSGTERHFSWDRYGINAYCAGSASSTAGVTNDKFVRFDKWGIYGLQGARYDTEFESEDALVNAATFSLTWTKGLQMKNTTTGQGYLKLSAAGLGTVTGQGNKIISAGTSSEETFYVTDTGYLYAKNVKVEGDVDAHSVKVDGTAIMPSGSTQISSDYLNVKGISVTNDSGVVTFSVSSQGVVSVNGNITMNGGSINWNSVADNGAYSLADSAWDNANAIKNGTATGTFINQKRIITPQLISNLVKVIGTGTNSDGTAKSGTFEIWQGDGSTTGGEGSTKRGYVGYARGSTGAGDTEGIAMVATTGEATAIGTAPQVIATNAGIRLTAGTGSLYILTSDNKIYYRQAGGAQTELGVAVFG